MLPLLRQESLKTEEDIQRHIEAKWEGVQGLMCEALFFVI